MGDIHWQLAKNGQEPARLATPDGSFSLPYDATMPCRAKVGMPGGFLELLVSCPTRELQAHIDVQTQVLLLVLQRQERGELVVGRMGR